MNINVDSAKDTLCKNILIYGYCKYENKGCLFNHSGPGQKGQNPGQAQQVSGQGLKLTGGQSSTFNMSSGKPAIPSNGDNKRRFNTKTPSFQPSGVQNLTNKFSNLSPNLKEIPVFVPSGNAIDSSVSTPLNELDNFRSDNSTSISNISNASNMNLNNSTHIAHNSTNTNDNNNNNNNSSDINSVNDSPTFIPGKKFNTSTPSFTPTSTYTNNIGGTVTGVINSSQDGTLQLSGNQPNPYLPSNANPSTIMPSASDMFFSNQSTPYSLQYHLYAPAPPPRLTVPVPPYVTNANEMFIPNELRLSLQKKNEATLQTLARSNLPEHINIYHSLVPIDKSYERFSKVWGIPSSVFKVFSNLDGNPYALRKLEHGFLISTDVPFKTIKRWRTIKCANIVQLQEAFTTVSFGTLSLVVAYDYYPNSDTLIDHHKKTLSKIEPITEELLWTYICQITNALLAIHEKGLAARSSLDGTKIIVTNKNRIRLASVGVTDILKYQEDEEHIKNEGLTNYTKSLQKSDIKTFGKLILDLASLTLPHNLRSQEPTELLKALKLSGSIKFSDELVEAILSLLFDEDFDLAKFNAHYLASRLLNLINNLEDSTDYMESQLTSELENARLFRLVAKLNFVIDRPEYPVHDNSNKHIAKLFRDFVFCEYDDFGKPVLNLSRVLVNLNKLDAGIDEKFLLVSRDDKNCVIASYKEVRDIIDSLFGNLARG
ncbi:uncharacterized protein PRCAT00005615001 [Priceomyces carsonii]|uniref:uncharacterized protein n=1 Tax=Priceomyces carsonii TaxID=28549 RepID=UPI002EDB7228|nr:unnamed protein product [Priceomyces carsonii]